MMTMDYMYVTYQHYLLRKVVCSACRMSPVLITAPLLTLQPLSKRIKLASNSPMLYRATALEARALQRRFN